LKRPARAATDDRRQLATIRPALASSERQLGDRIRNLQRFDRRECLLGEVGVVVVDRVAQTGNIIAQCTELRQDVSCVVVQITVGIQQIALYVVDEILSVRRHDF